MCPKKRLKILNVRLNPLKHLLARKMVSQNPLTYTHTYPPPPPTHTYTPLHIDIYTKNTLTHTFARSYVHFYSRSQFHQRFTSSVFVRKQIEQLLSSYVWLCNFWRQNFVQKTRALMLMKLTLGF